MPVTSLAQHLHTGTLTDLLESLRDYLERRYWLRPWYLLQPPASPYSFDSTLVDEASGEGACYEFAERQIHFGPAVTLALHAFCGGSRTAVALSALRTAVHELWHAASRMPHDDPMAYAAGPVARLVEEGTAEFFARQVVTRDLLGLGDYRPFMEDRHWEAFFGRRTLESNGIWALAAGCGESAVLDLWRHSTASARTKAINEAVMPLVQSRLTALGASAGLLDAAGSLMLQRGYRLLLDMAASPPLEARRPDDVPLALLEQASDLPAALSVLHSVGIALGVAERVDTGRRS